MCFESTLTCFIRAGYQQELLKHHTLLQELSIARLFDLLRNILLKVFSNE